MICRRRFKKRWLVMLQSLSAVCWTRRSKNLVFRGTLTRCEPGRLAVRITMKSNRTWKFFRAGGFDQVKLESGSDLLALDQLDQKLWVALACPTTGLHFDSRTLALVDTD